MEEQVVHPESNEPAASASPPQSASAPSPPPPTPEPSPTPTASAVPTPPVPESSASTNPLPAPAETLPVPPAAPAGNPPLPPKQHSGRLLHLVLAVVFGAAILGAAGGVGYWLGKSKASVATDQPKQSSPAASKELAIPKGATIIAQCAVGRGTQYVLPGDIPHGPVYNVWQNKVIGIEYMFGKDELLAQNKNYLNLPLHDVKYDHINIGLLSQGHAGFPQPHYHVDVFTVPDATAKSITCK